ncbi:histidine phosphatase family protein [Aestuariimicrobium ganziense]|uniref:histidine phosphatase family protein n=1 Tax=Aestuariimicrobium ganziense TaxID=2773677 RepID=UPI002E2CABF0|nr:histidine phosphatase family protein [Aestuariimicrobium ganziense]
MPASRPRRAVRRPDRRPRPPAWHRSCRRTDIAERHAGESVLVVSHGLFLNRMIHALLGLEGRVLGSLDNAHHSELLHGHGAWTLVAHNVG